MRLKKPFVEAFDAVKITRDGDAAIIEYLEPGVMTTRYVLGPEMSTMSDREIHRRFNRGLIATEELRAGYQHVAASPADAATIKAALLEDVEFLETLARKVRAA